MRRSDGSTLGVLEPAIAVDPRDLGPRTLLGLAGAAAVLVLALTPLTLRAPKPLPIWSAAPSSEPESLPVSLAANPALRFDLTDSEPTFRAMADQLPAVEGQPSVEMSVRLEPVARYASLAPLPPEMSTESVPTPQIDEASAEPVDGKAQSPHLAEEQARTDVATTGSYSDPGRSQSQPIGDPRIEPPRSRVPRDVSRSATEPRPPALTKPPQASRASRQAARPARQAAAVQGAKSGPARGENRSWSLPRELQPTGL